MAEDAAIDEDRTSDAESAIAAEAKAFGVETSFYDARGTLRVPTAAVLQAIVGVLSRSKALDGEAPRVVHVLRRGETEMSSAAIANATQWCLEQDGRVVALGEVKDGTIRFPEPLATGSYRLVLDEPGTAPREDPLLVAPTQAWQPARFDDGGRAWAIAVQLYGVTSRRNWGIGDFTDLTEAIRLAAHQGAAGVALNPLHAITLDDPEAISPYSPTSRLFLNPLYIDVEAIPEFPGVAAMGLGEEIARLREAELVDYAGVIRVKLAALKAAHAAFRAKATKARRADFAAFKAERGDTLSRYAAFVLLRERHGAPWWEWPQEWRDPTHDAIADLWRDDEIAMEFQAFLQWIADRQLAACATEAKRLGLPIGLYLDVAVGVSADSADVWANQGAYVRELSAGAPPDYLNTAGQDWGLASFNPRALMATDFRLLRETLRAVMRHAGAIRLDHVLGFNRLYLVPQGCKADEGTYVQFPFAAMIAVVAQESERENCLVIGEDLGTVPDGFRDTMADWNIWSYRILLFERGAKGAFKPPDAYPEQALVSFSTHDLATFAGWLERHDLAVKRELGLDPGETDKERNVSHHLLWEALHAAGAPRLSFPEVVRFLARTPSRLLVVAAEDVLGVLDQPNIPGTINEHPNWRRKLPVMLEDIALDPRLTDVAEVLRAEERATS